MKVVCRKILEVGERMGLEPVRVLIVDTDRQDLEEETQVAWLLEMERHPLACLALLGF